MTENQIKILKENEFQINLIDNSYIKLNELFIFKISSLKKYDVVIIKNDLKSYELMEIERQIRLFRYLIDSLEEK